MVPTNRGWDGPEHLLSVRNHVFVRIADRTSGFKFGQPYLQNNGHIHKGFQFPKIRRELAAPLRSHSFPLQMHPGVAVTLDL